METLALSGARFSVVPGGRSAVVPAPLHPQVLAAIDVGSNSVKLLVARAGEDGHLNVLTREKAMIRLGQETLRVGRLSEKALVEGTESIARFARLARAQGAERILCAATCAVREAANAADLARRVKEAADVDLEVISGEEEARLITRAVRSDFPGSADPLLVLDIGGGSTEVIVGSGAGISIAESLELGAVRLSESFVRTDPIEGSAVRALRDEVDRRMKRLAREVRRSGYRTAVGTSGTIAALADIAARLEERPVSSDGHRTLSRRSLARVADRLVQTTLREKLKLPGVEPRRADLLVAGALLLSRLMELLGVKVLSVCDRSLRDGLVLDELDRLMVGRTARRSLTPETRDVRRESVLRLARRSHLEWPHAERARDLSLRVFDQLHALHQLADREREWLEHGAFLHDVGTSISYLRHHKHSAYLIAHGELKGFSAEEVQVIALLARYHRKGRPKASHAAFASLDPWTRPVVEKLAAILRLADGLDRTHRQLVSDVEVTVLRKRVVFSVLAAPGADLEIWAAEKKSRLFRRVFDRDVELRLVSEARADTISTDGGQSASLGAG